MSIFLSAKGSGGIFLTFGRGNEGYTGLRECKMGCGFLREGELNSNDLSPLVCLPSSLLLYLCRTDMEKRKVMGFVAFCRDSSLQ